MAIPLAARFAVQEATVGRRLTVSMIVGFLALLAVGGAAAWSTMRTQKYNEWVTHTYRVENAILDARRLIEQGETARRGLMLAPGMTPLMLSYRTAVAELPERLNALALLTADNSAQRQNLARLQRMVDRLLMERDETIALVKRGRADRAIAGFRTEHSSYLIRAIRARFDVMAAEERRLLASREMDMRNSVRAFYAILAFAGILLLTVAIISLLTVLSFTRRLTRSRDALRTLNAGLEDRVTERTADLTRANEEIQRFAYIVSHDLRSPLVNVMGFTAELEAATHDLRDLVERAEADAPHLLTDDARRAARDDLPEAIGFIRTSTQKMDRLINAILQLSRHGRRTLAPEPVDMAALVETIGETLAHRLGDADATLAVEGTLPVIVTDRFAVDQVMSNLIDNAVKYLRPGVPGRIMVRGRREGARALFEIEDNGRGIDPRDHARVFDLFRRSGTQDVKGEGIGLATVRALVFRLGGVIDVVSTLGQGAIFRLSLPSTMETPQEGSE